MKSIRFIVFALFALLTLAAPLSIIWKYETALHYGALHKFRTKPIDPYDAFRGRYVTLSFADDFVTDDGSIDNPAGTNESTTPLYVRLKRDAAGFSVPAEVSRAPLSGDDVVTIPAAAAYHRDNGWTLYYPFDRYYLREDIAPLAEKLYRDANRAPRPRGDDAPRPQADTYVTIRVRNGVGVIEELYLNGLPVREAVRAEMKERP